MNTSKLQLKRNEVSRRINFVCNTEILSSSKAQRLKQKLIAELHTLDFALGVSKEIDSDNWFLELNGDN